MSNSSNKKQSSRLSRRSLVSNNENVLDDYSPTFIPSQSQQSDWWENISDRSARKSRLPKVPKKTANILSRSSSSDDKQATKWQQYLSDSDTAENINMFKPTKTKHSDTYEQQDDNILNDDSLKTNKLFQDRHMKKARYSQAFNEIEESLEVIPDTQESELLVKLPDTQATATKPGSRSKRKVKKAIFRKSQVKPKLSDAFVDESITAEQPEPSLVPELTKKPKFPEALTQEDEPVTNEDTNDHPHLEVTTEQTKKQLFKKSSHVKQKYSEAFAENSEVIQPETSNKTTDPSNILPPPELTNELIQSRLTLEDAEKKLFKKRIDEEKRTYSEAFVENEPSLSGIKISDVHTIENPEEIQPEIIINKTAEPTNILPPPESTNELIADKKLFKKRMEEDKRTFSKAFAENESSLSKIRISNVHTIAHSKKSNSSNLSEFPSLPSLGDISSDDEQKRRLFKPRRRSTPKSKSASEDNSISKNFETTLLSSTRNIRDEKAFSDPETPARKKRKSSLAAATTPLLTIAETKETSFNQTESQQMVLKFKENIKKAGSSGPVLGEIDLTLGTDSENESGQIVMSTKSKVSAVENQSILKITNPTTAVRTPQVTSESSDGIFVVPKALEKKNSEIQSQTNKNHSKKWKIADKSESELEKSSEQKESNIQIPKSSTSNNSKKSRVDEQSEHELESSDDGNIVMPTKSKLQTLDNQKTTRVENQNQSSDNETINIPAKESSIKDNAEAGYEHLNIEVSYSPVEDIHKPTTSNDQRKRSSKIDQKRTKKTSETNVENEGSAEEIPVATRSQRKLRNQKTDEIPIVEHQNIKERSTKNRKTTKQTEVNTEKTQDDDQNEVEEIFDEFNESESSFVERNEPKDNNKSKTKNQTLDVNNKRSISKSTRTKTSEAENEESEEETNRGKLRKTEVSKIEDQKINKRSTLKERKTAKKTTEIEESEEEIISTATGKKLSTTKSAKTSNNENIKKRSILKGSKTPKNPSENEEFEEIDNVTTTRRSLLNSKSEKPLEMENQNIKKRSTVTNDRISTSDNEIENDEIFEDDYRQQEIDNDENIMRSEKDTDVANEESEEPAISTRRKQSKRIKNIEDENEGSEEEDILSEKDSGKKSINKLSILKKHSENAIENEESEEAAVSTSRKRSKKISKIEGSEKENIVSEKDSGKKSINKRSILKKQHPKLKKHSENAIENEESEEAAVSTSRKRSKKISKIEEENEGSEEENIVSEKDTGKKTINKRSISKGQQKLKKHSKNTIENEEFEEPPVSTSRKRSKKISKIEEENEGSEEKNIMSEKDTGKKSIKKRSILKGQQKLKKHSKNTIENEKYEEPAEIEDQHEESEEENIVSKKDSGKKSINNKRSIKKNQQKLKKHSQNAIEKEEFEEPAVSSRRKISKRISEIEDENKEPEEENIVSKKDFGKKSINKRSILKKHSENAIENEEYEEPTVSTRRKISKRISEIEDENEESKEENIVAKKDFGKKTINKHSILKKHSEDAIENEESEESVVSTSRKKSKSISENEESEEGNIVSKKDFGKKSINKRSILKNQQELKKYSENAIENEESEESAVSTSRKKSKRITEIEETEKENIVSKKSTNKRSISKGQQKLKKHSENPIENEESAISTSRKKSKSISENEESEEGNIVSKKNSGKKSQNKRSNLINQKSKNKESTEETVASTVGRTIINRNKSKETSVENQINTKENRSLSFRRKLTYTPEDIESENIVSEHDIIPTTSTGRITKNNPVVRPSETSDILHFQEVENFIKNIRQPSSDYAPGSKQSLFERKSTISNSKKRIVDEMKKKSKTVSKKSPIRQQPPNVTKTSEKQLKQKKLLDFFTTIGNNIRLLEQNKKPEPKKKTISSENAQMPKRKSTANLVDGKVYKPKLYKIRKWWCNDRLYSYLQKQMRNIHSDKTVIESEKLMKQICDSVTITMRKKTYLPTEINKLKIALAKNNVIETTYDFHNFIEDYLPYEYKEWVVPIPKLYGPEIPYDRATLFEPIEY